MAVTSMMMPYRRRLEKKFRIITSQSWVWSVSSCSLEVYRSIFSRSFFGRCFRINAATLEEFRMSTGVAKVVSTEAATITG